MMYLGIYKKLSQKLKLGGNKNINLAWADVDKITSGNAGLDLQNAKYVYPRMLNDEQISALLSLKQSFITARKWRFEHDSQDPLQSSCAKFFNFVLTRQIEGSLNGIIRNLLTAQVSGFSILEKIYGSIEWQNKTLWGIKSLKLRPAHSFRFIVDQNGSVQKLIQQQDNLDVELPYKHFVHYVNRSEISPHYGESDLKPCHRHWVAKEKIYRLWGIYLERMSSGFIHGKVSGQISPKDREELKRILHSAGERTSIITPASVDLSLVSAPSTDAFERAISARDKAIAKALLVPNLLGFSEQGTTGSYSQSKVQLEMFLMVMNSITESISETLNEQLFRELAFWNFGLEKYPLLAFDPLSESQKQQMIDTWLKAVFGNAISTSSADEAHIRQLLGFPQTGSA